MPNLSQHNISRAAKLLQGSAALGTYNQGRAGVEWVPTFLWRPTNPAAALVFTGVLAAGATSATLNASWSPPTGIYSVTLSTGQVLQALLTSGGTTCTFWNQPATGGTMTAATVISAATATATVAGVPPALAVATAYAASQAVGAGANAIINGTQIGSITVNGVTYTTAGLPDVPRNVVGAWTTASVITVTGLDYYGQLQTEASASGTSFTGKKAFSVIISISSSASITAATFGKGAVLGLPFKVASGGFMGAFLNDATDAGTFVQGDPVYPPTNSTGDVRGTYTTSGALNGAKQLVLELRVKDPTLQLDAFGYTPA